MLRGFEGFLSCQWGCHGDEGCGDESCCSRMRLQGAQRSVRIVIEPFYVFIYLEILATFIHSRPMVLTA